MTHPFHPLSGQVLEVIDRRRREDGEVVYLEAEPDRVIRLPQAWTSLGAPDAFVVLAGGRSLYRVEDLLRLAELVAEIDRGHGEDEGGDV